MEREQNQKTTDTNRSWRKHQSYFHFTFNFQFVSCTRAEVTSTYSLDNNFDECH